MVLSGLAVLFGTSVAVAQPTDDVEASSRSGQTSEPTAGPRVSDVPAWPFTPRDGSHDTDPFEVSETVDTTAGQGMQVAGIVMTVSGALGAVLGGGLLIEAEVSKSACEIRDPDSDSCNFAQLPERIAGASLVVPSGLLAVIGVPLWIAGDMEAGESERQRTASAAPSVAVGPTSVRMTWTF